MEESQETEPVKQTDNRPWLWKKGQSGNPNGRPKGKTAKERAKDYLVSMTDEEFEEFLHGIDKKTIWEMAEGKAKQETELRASVTIADVLKDIENGNNNKNASSGDVDTTEQIIGQIVADSAVIQDTQQEERIDNIPQEPSPGALPTEQVVEKYNPEEQAAGLHD